MPRAKVAMAGDLNLKVMVVFPVIVGCRCSGSGDVAD
jgi:hypothetical protein